MCKEQHHGLMKSYCVKVAVIARVLSFQETATSSVLIFLKSGGGRHFGWDGFTLNVYPLL